MCCLKVYSLLLYKHYQGDMIKIKASWKKAVRQGPREVHIIFKIQLQC